MSDWFHVCVKVDASQIVLANFALSRLEAVDYDFTDSRAGEHDYVECAFSYRHGNFDQNDIAAWLKLYGITGEVFMCHERHLYGNDVANEQEAWLQYRHSKSTLAIPAFNKVGYQLMFDRYQAVGSTIKRDFHRHYNAADYASELI